MFLPCRVQRTSVALFARAWIEIRFGWILNVVSTVALFARAWIEIAKKTVGTDTTVSRPLCEGVD